MTTKLTKEELKKLFERFCRFQVVQFKGAKIGHEYDAYKKWREDLIPQLRFFKFLPLIEKDTSDLLTNEDFIEMNEICLDQIRTTLTDFYSKMIAGCTTAKEALAKIDKHFKGSVLVNTIRTVKELAKLITERRDDLETAIIEFKNVIASLQEVDSGISQSTQIALLVAVLPPNSETIVKRIIDMDEKKATGATLQLEDVLANIVSDHQMCRESSSAVGSSFNSGGQLKAVCAIKSTGYSQNAHSKSSGAQRTKCFYCQATDHVMADCKQLQQDQASGKIQHSIVIGSRRGRGKPNGNQTKDENLTNRKPNEQAQASASSSSKTGGNKKKYGAAIVLAGSNETIHRNAVIFDTGTSDVVANRLDGCTRMDTSYRETIYTAGESPLQVVGRGDFSFEGTDGAELNLTNVLYAPAAIATFIPWNRLDKAGFGLIGAGGVIKIVANPKSASEPKSIADQESEEVIFTATKNAIGLYETDLKPIIQTTNSYINAIGKFPQLRSKDQTPEVMYWHKTLNHVGRYDLKKLDNTLNILVNLDVPFNCLTCIEAKMKRFSFKLKGIRTTQPLEKVHTDTSGIIRIANFEGVRYFVVFLDDFTRFQVIFLLARKFQVYEAFVEYVAFMERQTGLKVKCLKSDNGTEFCNNRFDDFLKKKGIKRELTQPGTPQSNGGAERNNQTLATAARCSLIESNLDARFWPQAVAYAAKVKNVLPSAPIGGKIPAVEMFSKSIRYDDFKPFGSLCMVIKLDTSTKFEGRGLPAVMLGFPTERAGYEVYLLKERCVKSAREVVFLTPEEERQFKQKYGDLYPFLKNRELLSRLDDCDNEAITTQDRYLDYHAAPPFAYDDNEMDPNILHLIDSSEQEEQPSTSDDLQQRGQATSANQSAESTDDDHESNFPTDERPVAIPNDENQEERSPAIGDFQRFAIEPPPNGRYLLTKDQVNILKEQHGNTNFRFVAPCNLATSDNPICQYNVRTRLNAIVAPKSYGEALKSEHSERWKAAMDEEYASLVANDTWSLVPRPKGVRVLPTMWLYTVKTNRYGEIERYKARCVVLGNKQVSLEPEDTHAPVANLLSIRIVLLLATKYKMHLHGIDVKTAFLYPELQDDVYIQQLKGYINNKHPLFVLKLNKSMYGLRCAAKNWYRTIVEVLTEFGLKQIYSDECVFSNCHPEIEQLIIVVIHVDDGAIVSRNLALIESLKDHLKSKFQITDHGELKSFLGYSIDYDREKGTMRIDQKKYAVELLKKFGMEHCKKQRTPVGVADELMIEHVEVLPFEQLKEYQEIVGGLNYLANGSRPDIAFLVSVLCRYISNPATVHYQTAKRILRYLNGTVESHLLYSANEDNQLIIYADADHANCKVTSKSISGICSVLCGGLVGWSSYKQNRVAGATCESEILATLDGVNEAEYIDGLLGELCVRDRFIRPARLYNDNKGANLTVQTAGKFKSNKQYRIRVNQIRRAVENDLVRVQHEPGVSMVSDALTKQLPIESVRMLLQIVNFKLI